MATVISIRALARQRNPSYVDKLRFVKAFDTINIAKNRVNFTKSDKIRLTKRFKKIKRYVSPTVAFIPLDSKTLAKLKNKNMATTGLGVFIARPQDDEDKPVKGVRVRVNKNGVTVLSKGPRTQYIVPLSQSDVIELIQSTPNINNSVVKRIFVQNPGLAKKWRAALNKDRHVQIVYRTHRSAQRFDSIAALNDYIDNMADIARKAITALSFNIFIKPKTISKSKRAKKNDTQKKSKNKRNNRR